MINTFIVQTPGGEWVRIMVESIPRNGQFTAPEPVLTEYRGVNVSPRAEEPDAEPDKEPDDDDADDWDDPLDDDDDPGTEEPDDEPVLTTTRISIRNVLTAGGEQQIQMKCIDSQGDLPPLMEVIGMLEMSKDTAYRLYRGEFEDDDEDD